MQKTIIKLITIGAFAMLFSGCAGDNYAGNNYNSGYNSYENQNDRAVNNAISEEMNSLSDKDIAQLNTLK